MALVTGASRGIGRSIALQLASAGADVAINYRENDTAAEEVVREASALGVRALKFRCGVGDTEGVNEMVSRIRESLGEVDILVNNAGVTKDNSLIRMEREEFAQVIETNLIGAFNCAKAVAFPMMRRRKGRIINISSVSGITGAPGQCNYSASKGGLIAFTKALARELSPFGVTVNAVAPGFIETDMTARLPTNVREKVLPLIPMGHFGQPEDVAGAVVFLSSDYGKYVTGQVITVDGGLTA